MRRQISILSLAVMFLFFTTAANAVTFTATTSDNTVGISASDTVTIDITVVLDAGDSINSLGSSVYGWDNSVVSFTSGEGVSGVFYQSQGAFPPTSPNCVTFPSLCLPTAPLATNKGLALVEGAAGGGTGFTGQPEVEIIAGLDVAAFYTPNTLGDIGLDGSVGSTQFSLTFHATGPGSTTIIIGGGSDLNGAVGPTGVINNDSITISVIPEPGTALLMGLGLAGLAAAGRRQLPE
jgi:hypothetical protein